MKIYSKELFFLNWQGIKQPVNHELKNIVNYIKRSIFLGAKESEYKLYSNWRTDIKINLK